MTTKFDDYIFSNSGSYDAAKIGFATAILLLCSMIGYAQTGNTLQNPIVAGSFGSGFQYSNSQNTSNFTNNYSGRSSNDVFYKFTLTVPMDIVIDHCGSSLSDTYLHLLDESGNRIAYNDDTDNTCLNYYHSYLRRNLHQGTYYVVSEGYSQNGVILTTITGSTTLHGNTMEDAIDWGSIDDNFICSDTQNTSYFTNNFTGRPSNDVFYKLTLFDPMEIIVSHCGSTLSDTYLHILNSAGNVILYNDDYSGMNHCSNTLHPYLKTVLQAGTYYIVSEGYSQNGVIQTTIEGRLAYLWYDYDACGNRIERYGYEDIYSTPTLRSSKNDKEETVDETTALNSMDDNASIIVRPNPTNGPLTVVFAGDIDLSNTHIHVINTESRIIFSQKVQTEKTVINLSAYPTGIYLVKIQSDEKTVTKKILKK
jgi:hypothetical protein